MTRKTRRTKKDMAVIRAAIGAVLAADHPQTVRQVFYRLTSAGVVEKTEADYLRTVCRLLGEMRRSGEIPFGWITDGTRVMRKPVTFSNGREALRRTAAFYRQSLWDSAPVVPEIWLEKDALSGVLYEVTYTWDVPLMTTRGYSSMSFLYSAAEAILERAEQDRHTIIYYFGDHDPSGVDIDRQIVKGIGESLVALGAGYGDPDPEAAFADAATFIRVAVVPAQIKSLGLQTRPTKRDPNDHRAKKFVGDSVEVDAIAAATLRALAEQCIEQHHDPHELAVLQAFEEEERRGLEKLIDGLEAA